MQKAQPTFLYEWSFSLGLGPLQKDPNSREEFDFKQLVEALSSKCSIEEFEHDLCGKNLVSPEQSCLSERGQCQETELEQAWPYCG
jgi:hypothetical protein